MIKNIQKKMGVLSAERNYKPVHLLLMFFIFSVVGWVWEVILGYMTGGMIVNRGVLHSPLLPIYGKGVILILVLLKRFRKYPVAEFAGIILCQAVWSILSHGILKWSTMANDGGTIRITG